MSSLWASDLRRCVESIARMDDARDNFWAAFGAEALADWQSIKEREE